MFTSHCTACDKTQLVFLSQISGMRDTERGTVVSYTCWCGAAQEWAVAAVRETRASVAA
jgi:hypothetical protein